MTNLQDYSLNLRICSALRVRRIGESWENFVILADKSWVTF